MFEVNRKLMPNSTARAALRTSTGAAALPKRVGLRARMALVFLLTVLLAFTSVTVASPRAHADEVVTISTSSVRLDNNFKTHFVLRVSKDVHLTELTGECTGRCPGFGTTAGALSTASVAVGGKTVAGAQFSGVSKKSITVKFPSGVDVRSSDTFELVWPGNLTTAAGWAWTAQGELLGGTPDPVIPGEGADEVGPSANLAQINSGASHLDFSQGDTAFALKTQALEAGSLKEAYMHIKTPATATFAWNQPDKFTLWVDGRQVAASVRVDNDDLYFTLDNAIDIANGAQVEARGIWKVTGSLEANLTLWVPKIPEVQPNPEPEPDPEYPGGAGDDNAWLKDYTRVPLDANSQPQCVSGANHHVRLFWRMPNFGPAEDIKVLRIRYREDIPSNFDATKITVDYAGHYIGTNSRVDNYFETKVYGNEIYLVFKNPLKRKGETPLLVTIPRGSTALGLACPKFDGFAAPQSAAQWQCTSPVTKDFEGQSIPQFTNTSRKGRQAPRALTDAEKATGGRVFVVTSDPVENYRYSSRLWEQPKGARSFQPVGQTTGWVYNALAYNPKDNWLYAISQGRIGQGFAYNGSQTVQEMTSEDPCFPAGHLLQIDPTDGTVYDLGRVTRPGYIYAFGGEDLIWRSLKVKGNDVQGYLPTQYKNDLYGGINAGAFSEDGRYYVSNSSSTGTDVLYEINVGSVTGGPTNFKSLAEDYTALPEWAFGDGPVGNYLWGMQSRNDKLERINLDTGKVDTLDISGLRSPLGKGIDRDQIWGKAWSYGNGNLGFGTGSAEATTEVFQLKVENPNAERLEDAGISLVTVNPEAPKSYNTDATSFFLRDDAIRQPDLKVEKKAAYIANEGLIEWSVRVTNTGTGGSSGFVLNDPFPAGYQVVRDYVRPYKPAVTVRSEKNPNREVEHNEFVLRVEDHDFVQVLVGGVPQDDSIVITIKGKIPSGQLKQCVQNTARIIPNESEPAGATVNNESTASLWCELALEKHAIDLDGDGIDVKDSAKEVELNGKTYKSVRFDLVVSNPGDVALPYQLTDQEQFTKDVTPKFVQIKVKTTAGANASLDSTISPNPSKWISVTANQPLDITSHVHNADNENQRSIDPKQKHYYELQYLFEMNPQTKLDGVWNNLQCEGSKMNGTSYKGLFNMATLHDIENDRDLQDADCVPVDQPKITDAFVKLTKVDADNAQQPLDGAQFEIRVANADGSVVDPAIQPEADGTYKVKDNWYQIRETQAPNGYSLLAKPMYFHAYEEKGAIKVSLAELNNGKLQNATGELPLVSLLEPETNKDGVSTFTIQIADITTGDLPVSGGSGFLPIALLGALFGLAAIAAAGIRKRPAA